MITWSGGHGPVPLTLWSTNQEESVPTSKFNDLALLAETAWKQLLFWILPMKAFLDHDFS